VSGTIAAMVCSRDSLGGVGPGGAATRLDRIASGTARRAAKSKFGLFSIVVTQRFHIFKIRIDSFVYWDIFYMYHYKNYDRNMLVAFYSSEKSLHLIMA
jgi:hypothetical protein